MGDRREGLLLAHTFEPYKHKIAGWYASEKKDGERCFYDGGITRGIPATKVPFAYNPKPSEISTSLWTRNFKVVHAPDVWLDKLPKGITLDGELFTERGDFQTLMSIVRTELNPSEFLWSKVKFCVFDSPGLRDVLIPGRMRVRGEDFFIKTDSLDFIRERLTDIPNALEFRNVYDVLKGYEGGNITVLEQTQLEPKEEDARVQMRLMMNNMLEIGAEGLMLRNPKSRWFCKRSNDLLKVKDFQDSEAKVIGAVDGKGRHFERLGALMVEWINPIDKSIKKFEIGGGLTDEEREWTNVRTNFAPGTVITFRYIGLTDDGVPRHAAYWRKRN